MTDPIVILLVEDEAAHAEAIRRAFEAAGAETQIQVAGSLREYRAAVAACPPDIVLMDLNLPDGRAMEVLTSPPVASPFPILIMTSYGNEHIAVETMKAGALDYVMKSPEAFADMPRTVERALREWDLLRERRRAEEALRRSEERFRALNENSMDGIALFDANGSILLFPSAATARILGYGDRELVGQSVFERMHPADLPSATDLFRRVAQEPGHCETAQLRFRHQDGSWRWLEYVCQNLLAVPSVQAIVVNYRDISERKRAEERMLKEGYRTASLLRIANRLNAELDLDKLLAAVCEETALALGVPGASVALYEPDAKVFRIVASVGLAPESHEHLTPIPHSLYIEYIEHLGSPFVVPNEQLWFNLPNVGLPRGGNPRTSVVATISRVDQVIGTLNVHTLGAPRAFGDDDLAVLQGLADEVALAIVNARLFTEVGQQREQLHALHRQLAETQEAERRQLAQELHDQASQNLTAIGFNLNLLRTQMLPGTDTVVQARLTDSLALVEQTTESIRNVMANLRPCVLDDYGLVAALRWYGAEVAARTGLFIDVLGDEPVSRLPAPLENTLFRIAQEALTNVIKHARASQVTVAVELESGKVRLLIADNGIGFDHGLLTKPENHRHWGLRVMTERAVAAKGSCRFESHPGKGTQVIVEAPR